MVSITNSQSIFVCKNDQWSVFTLDGYESSPTSLSLSPLSSPYFLTSLLLFYAREDPKVYDDDAMQYTLMLYSFLHYTFNLTCQVSLDIRKYIKLRLRGGCSIFLQLS
jgi:hypothetical protein